MNMISEDLARKHKIFVNYSDAPRYRARDIQGNSINIIGTAIVYLINRQGWHKRLLFTVARDLPDEELLINLTTMIELGILTFKFQEQELSNTGFTKPNPDEKDSEFEEIQHGFVVRKVCRIQSTNKQKMKN